MSVVHRVLRTINSDFWDFQTRDEAIEWGNIYYPGQFNIRYATQDEIQDAVNSLLGERDKFQFFDEESIVIRVYRIKALELLQGTLEWYQSALDDNDVEGQRTALSVVKDNDD